MNTGAILRGSHGRCLDDHDHETLLLGLPRCSDSLVTTVMRRAEGCGAPSLAAVVLPPVLESQSDEERLLMKISRELNI